MFSIEEIQQIVLNNAPYAWLFVFGFAFMESLIIVGSIVSAAILFSICVYLHHTQILSMYFIVPLAITGAHLGDVTSFLLGKRIGPSMLKRKFFQKHKKIVTKGKNMVERFGSYSVIVGRFTPGLRPIVPFLLGLSDCDSKRFYPASVVAVLCWGMALIVLTIGVEKLF
jgi:membrane-associated protein